MEPDHRAPLIRTSGELGYLTRSRLSDAPMRLDSPSLRLNSVIVPPNPEDLTRPLTPAFNSSKTRLAEEVIKDLSTYVEKVYPKVINSPYSFSDVKILSTQVNALAVTNEGFAIFIDVEHSTFEEQSLSQHALASVVVSKGDGFAFVKERDHGKIYLIELPSMKVKKTLKISGETTNGIGKMCLSPDENSLYARLWKGEIVRWEMPLLREYQVMLAERNVACMNLSPDGIFVVGTADKKLILFSLQFAKICEKSLDFIVDAYICFSSDSSFIMLGMSKSIKVFSKDTLDLVQEIETNVQANDVRMTKDNKYIIAALESGHLCFFGRGSNLDLRIKIHESGIKTIHITLDQDKIYTFGSDSKLSHVNFPVLTLFMDSDQVRSIDPDVLFDEQVLSKTNLNENDDQPFKALCIVVNSSTSQLIAGGESNIIYLFDADSLSQVGDLPGHQDYVYSLALLNDRYLASGSADHTVIIWDLANKSKKSSLFRHFGTVSALCRLDNKRLASGSHDRSIKIWIWDLEQMVYSISELPDPVLALSLAKPGYIMAGYKGLIQCWSITTFNLIFEKTSEKEIKCLKMLEIKQSQSIQFFFLLDPKEPGLFIENPLLTESVTCWGPDENRTYEFISYIREIFSGKLPQYDEYMDLWLITPYNISIVHIYSYFNLHHYLAQSLMNGAALINSVTNFNALTIALDMKNKECVEVIIKNLWKQYQFNPFVFSCIDVDTVQRLNLIDTYLLPKVYKLMVVSADYGKFFTDASNLPVVHLAFTNIMNPKQILHGIESKGDAQAKFLFSSLNLYLNPGSGKSIQFMKTLLECKHPEVFNTDLVQYILLFKWASVKYFLFTELVIFVAYFIYLLLWMLFLSTARETWIVTALGFLLFLFNVYSSIISGSLFFENLVDFLRFGVLSTFLVANEAKAGAEFIQYLKMLTISLSFLQGLTYFKLFSQTRHVIRNALALFKESISLLFLLGYILSVVCILIFINQNKSGTPTLLISLDIDISQLIDFFQIFFDYIVPGLIVISLMALTGSSLDKTEADLSAEYKELAQIVLKGELCLVWKRKKNWLEFVHVCTFEHFKGIDRVKKVAKMVKAVKQGQDSQRFEILEGFDEIKKKIEEISSGLKEVRKEKRHRKK